MKRIALLLFLAALIYALTGCAGKLPPQVETYLLCVAECSAPCALSCAPGVSFEPVEPPPPVLVCTEDGECVEVTPR